MNAFITDEYDNKNDETNAVFVGLDDDQKPLYLSKEEAHAVSRRTMRLLGKKQPGEGLSFGELAYQFDKMRRRDASVNRPPIFAKKTDKKTRTAFEKAGSALFEQLKREVPDA